MDLRQTASPQLNESDSLPPVLQKFLDTSKVSSPVITGIARKIYRQEKKKPFVEKFVKYAGYPVWDKSMISKVRNLGSISTRGANDSSATVVMIPFSLRNDSTVNAILKVALTKRDTTFRMLYRWQYKRNGYEKRDSVNNADRTALFFMGMESQVYGHKAFKLNDTLLLKGKRTSDTIQIKSFGTGQVNGKIKSVEIEVCVVFDCIEGTWVRSASSNKIVPGVCQICDTYWAWVDDGTGAGGGNSDGGTGDAPPVPPGTSGGAPDDNGGWEENPCDGPGDGGNIPATRMQDPCDDPPAWEPVEDELPVLPDEDPITINLFQLLDLNAAETAWLDDNPAVAQAIVEGLMSSLTDVNPTNNLPYDYFPEYAISASKMTLIASMNGFITGPYNSLHFQLLLPYAPAQWNYFQDPAFWIRFAVECALIKAEHPEYGLVRVYWEAMKEMVHLGLDVAGLVPVFGEVADLANGAIYTIEGDGVNATLSFASAIPIGGWFSSGIKFAKRGLNLASGAKTTLKWIVRTDGLINFGSRGQLRKILGLATGDSRIAHHIIPWEHCNDELVQMAAKGNDAFHMNELLNGIPLTAIQHNGSHALYNDRVISHLTDIKNSLKNSGNFTPQAARQALQDLINNTIKPAIINNPTTPINQIVF